MQQNELAKSNTLSTGEIRQIQMLMALFSCLPPNSKLREALEHALALPHEPWLSRITPISDTSSDGLRAWLESQWVREGLTPDEQKLVDWQRSDKNIVAAVQELKAVEEKIGIRLDLQQIRREDRLASGAVH